MLLEVAPMLVLNFGHPLTAEQCAALEAATGAAIDRVVAVPTAFDDARPFEPQVADLIGGIGFTAEEWQTTPLLVVLPGHSAIAGVLLAHLHGLLGRFPPVARLRRADAFGRFAVAEIIDLQGVRDDARGGRFR